MGISFSLISHAARRAIPSTGTRQVPPHHPLPLQQRADGHEDATSTSIEGGNVWSPTLKPCKTALDSYECRHGMSPPASPVPRQHRSQPALLRPTEDLGEVQKLTLRNTSAKSEKTQTILLCRMVLVECRYGHGELPA